MFNKLNIFAVLDDGQSFSGAENAQIQVYPADKDMSPELMSDLQNGIIPDDGHLAIIDMDVLLKQAIEADLPCIQQLKKLL